MTYESWFYLLKNQDKEIKPFLQKRAQEDNSFSSFSEKKKNEEE